MSDASIQGPDRSGRAEEDVFVQRARAHLRSGRIDMAAEVARRGLLSAPDSAPGRLVLAEAEQARGRPADALEQLDHILARAPAHVGALTLSGRLLLAQGAHARAAEVLDRALVHAPGAPDLLRLREAAEAGLDPSPGDLATATGRADDEAPGAPTDPRTLDQRLASLPSLRSMTEPVEPTLLDEGAREAPGTAQMGGSAAELHDLLGVVPAAPGRSGVSDRAPRSASSPGPIEADDEPTVALPESRRPPSDEHRRSAASAPASRGRSDRKSVV